MAPAPPFAARRDVSSEWLRALVDSALDGVVTMDDQGRIIAFNPAAEKIFGYRSDQVIGHTVADTLIPRKAISDNDHRLAHFLATGRGELIGRRVEITAMRADGGTFPAEIGIISVTPEKARVFIAYIRDITKQKQAEAEQRQHALKIKKTLVQTILAISRTVEIRDPYTAGHQSRVAHLAATMAQALNLDGDRVEGVFLGALIHDIGKIAVPAQILSRPGELMDVDKRYLQLHCQKGYEILEPVDFPWPVAEVAFQHHEHMDGSGYPQGLRGEEILLEAEGTAPHYRIILDRQDGNDTMEVQVEISEAFPAFDELKNLERLRDTIARKIEVVLGVDAKVTLVEPRSLMRESGAKARRVTDNRSL